MHINKDLTIDETFNLAVKKHQENKIDIAQEFYNKVLKIDPNHSATHNNLGAIFKQLKDYQKAKVCYEKAIECNPNYVDAHNNLGAIFGQLKDHQKAISCYEKAIKINPNYVDAHNNLGAIFGQLKDHQKAISCYEKAIKINPNYVDAHYNLGTIFGQLKDHQKAKVCYEKAIKINPNHSQSLNNLAIIFTNLKEHQKAKSFYEKAIKTNPNYADAHNNLGVIYKQLGENQKAISFFEKAIKINPNYANAYYNLGNSFKDLRENQKAISFFEKAIKINPNYADTYLNLGTSFHRLNEHQKAKDCYEKAIKINPYSEDAYTNLGIIFHEWGEKEKIIDCFKKVIDINPDNLQAINLLASVLSDHHFNSYYKEKTEIFKSLFLFLFKKNARHSRLSKNAKLLLFSIEEQKQLEKVVNSESLFENEVLQKLLKEELFHLMLQKSLITDVILEKIIIGIRHKILLTLENSNIDKLKDYLNFIISLAEQSWLNEYIYIQSEEEINLVNKLNQKINDDKNINEFEIAILGTYIPLNKSEVIINKLSDYKSSNILFNDLIDVQIKEPMREKELLKSIKSLDAINNITSKKVREQYEKYPYPRWRFTDKILPDDTFNWINREITPNIIADNNKFDNPKVLVAGCGTGMHAIRTNRYKNANILAVDLSLSSLAYAKRKTEELGYTNIEYMHADILQLNKLNKKFDIIECAGTLHHMKDPIAGLKVLLDVLEPHGFLLMGLYSEKARKHVVMARELINKKKLNNTNEDIKNFRKDILGKKVDPLIQKAINHTDFYSISMLRDLFFHVQEHRFTIPQINKILQDFNLEFLGFVFSKDSNKKKFNKSFPNDKKNISLENWHQFEIDNPDSFLGMYQFWVRKIL